jgi:hypothetical protein
MINAKKAFMFLATALCLASTAVQASVVTFENRVPAGETFFYTTGPDTVDGMVFSYSRYAWFMHHYKTTDSNAPFDPTGTLFTHTNIDINMSQVGGAAFRLNSFDAGIYLTQPNAIITVTGELAGGGTISTMFDIAPNNFNTFSFSPAWANLAQVTFRMNDSAFIQYDNIVFDAAAAVPEPSSGALILLALGALGFAARRKK